VAELYSAAVFIRARIRSKKRGGEGLRGISLGGIRDALRDVYPSVKTATVKGSLFVAI